MTARPAPPAPPARPARPLISVVIPTYNRAALLRAAVQSVLGQTYDSWELVVVDDGSTDETAAYLDTLTDARVRHVVRAHSGNAALTRNFGARAARGSHVAFLDSDDLWRPEKLVLQMEDLEARPECGWSYTGVALVDEGGRELHPAGGRPWMARRGWILEDVVDRPALVATSSVLVRRQLFETVGGFNESLLRCHDLDLWIRLAEVSPASVVARPVTQWRQHPGNQRVGGLDVLGYRNRIYEALMERTSSPRVRRLCRRQRIRVSLDFVRGLRAAGRYAEARQALAFSFPYGGRHPGWWIAMLQMCLRRGIRGR